MQTRTFRGSISTGLGYFLATVMTTAIACVAFSQDRMPGKPLMVLFFGALASVCAFNLAGGLSILKLDAAGITRTSGIELRRRILWHELQHYKSINAPKTARIIALVEVTSISSRLHDPGKGSSYYVTEISGAGKDIRFSSHMPYYDEVVAYILSRVPNVPYDTDRPELIQEVVPFSAMEEAKTASPRKSNNAMFEPPAQQSGIPKGNEDEVRFQQPAHPNHTPLNPGVATHLQTNYASVPLPAHQKSPPPNDEDDVWFQPPARPKSTQ